MLSSCMGGVAVYDRQTQWWQEEPEQLVRQQTGNSSNQVTLGCNQDNVGLDPEFQCHWGRSSDGRALA